jgi:metal-dependent amidase/aminoacylase/carboxypeptidase family protein
MGSEDFGFMMEKVPAAHVFLGNGDSAVCHNDRYDFNDEAIPFGVALYAAIVEKKMPKARGLNKGNRMQPGSTF